MSHEWLSELIDGWMDEWLDGCRDVWLDEFTSTSHVQVEDGKHKPTIQFLPQIPDLREQRRQRYLSAKWKSNWKLFKVFSKINQVDGKSLCTDYYKHTLASVKKLMSERGVVLMNGWLSEWID